MMNRPPRPDWPQGEIVVQKKSTPYATGIRIPRKGGQTNRLKAMLAHDTKRTRSTRKGVIKP